MNRSMERLSWPLEPDWVITEKAEGLLLEFKVAAQAISR